MRARKSLGQHFLRDVALLDRIAAASGAAAGDVVLEIGPGPGGLTAALLRRGATVVAIEADPRMGRELTRRFAGEPFVLVEGDALRYHWPDLVQPWTAMGMPWRVVGNIPYYITSPLLDVALTPPLAGSITFLVQDEVARRLVAEPGTAAYGALTVGVQTAATVTRVFGIGRDAFSPPPKVDSAVVQLLPRQQPLVPPESTTALRSLVVSLFSYRRKRMQRALREARGISATTAAGLLERAGIDPDLRPEALSPTDFVALLRVTEREEELDER